MSSPTQTDYNVTALRKSVSVLEVLTEASEPLGLSEVARRSGVSKNMCLRILETLLDLGWVRNPPSGQGYELTLAPFQFFSGARNRSTLIDRVLEPLKRLNRETGESAYAGVLHAGRVLMVHVIKGTRPIAVTGEVGATFALHATAPGKVLLAWGDPDLLEQTIAAGLAPHTPETITDPADLRDEIAVTRANGYAVNLEEYGKGLLGLAAPVFEGPGDSADLLAAIGIFMPTTNVDPEELSGRYAEAVVKAADEATRG